MVGPIIVGDVDPTTQATPVTTTTTTATTTNSTSTTTTQLTINSLELYESGSQTRFHVIGNAPETTDLTFGIYGPNSSGFKISQSIGDGIGSTSTGAPLYDHDGLVSNTIDILSGGWNTFQVCARSYEMCVEESFTIDTIGYGTTLSNTSTNLLDFDFT